MGNSQENRFVGPVIKNGEVGDAVVEGPHLVLHRGEDGRSHANMLANRV